MPLFRVLLDDWDVLLCGHHLDTVSVLSGADAPGVGYLDCIVRMWDVDDDVVQFSTSRSHNFAVAKTVRGNLRY